MKINNLLTLSILSFLFCSLLNASSPGEDEQNKEQQELALNFRC